MVQRRLIDFFPTLFIHSLLAANEDDLNIFTLGLLKAEAEGQRYYLGRSAASFVASRAGILPKPILNFSGNSNISLSSLLLLPYRYYSHFGRKSPSSHR